MEQATQAALDRLVEGIVEAVHPLRIILFGSAARGDTGPDSDLDVLVVMPEGSPRLKTARRVYRNALAVGAPFDVVVATPAMLEAHRTTPGLIFRTALEEGVVYEKGAGADG